MSSFKILILTRYGYMGASSRLRFYQYIPFLGRDIGVDVYPLIDDYSLNDLYIRNRYSLIRLCKAYLFRVTLLLFKSKIYDLIWVEKELLPFVPYCIERMLLSKNKYVLDYDDAIFHNYDLSKHVLIRMLYSSKVHSLMLNSTLVVAGNTYLTNIARSANAAEIKLIPTVIDLQDYTNIKSHINECINQKLRLVWIGSPSTQHYLNLVLESLRALNLRVPFTLRLIGARSDFTMPGISIEHIAWTKETECQSLLESDIGIMPLLDTPWEQGKCGYKLIQYMACGLPVVASAVGANMQIVKEGKNGFLASSGHEWVLALERLLLDKNLRVQMGAAGRSMVESEFCVQMTAPVMSHLLKLAALK